MYSPSCTENDSIFNPPNHSDDDYSIENPPQNPSNEIDGNDEDDNETTEASIVAKPIDEDEIDGDKDENVILEGNLSGETKDLCRSDDKVLCSKNFNTYICDVQKCDGNRDCPGGEDEQNCPKDESIVQEGSGEEIEVGTKEETEQEVEIGSESKENASQEKSSEVAMQGELFELMIFLIFVY